MTELDTPIQYLPGVGAKRAKLFERLGIATAGDLLWLAPRLHLDRTRVVPLSGLRPGEEQTTLASLGATRPRRARGLHILEVELRDGPAAASAVWFNQPFLTRVLRPGAEVLLHGKVKLVASRLQFQNPEYELLSEGGLDDALQGGRIVPVYPLTTGLTQRAVRSASRAALEQFRGRVPDPLPAHLLQAHGFPSRESAFRALHFPERESEVEPARSRLAFDEFLALQLALGLLKREREELRPPHATEQRSALDASAADRWIESLPFELTGAQRRVRAEIERDLASGRPMNRLLQGDVGSGKTVVAALAALDSVRRGLQVAYLAPTEILAQQQFETFRRWMAPAGLEVGLLLGRTRAPERRELFQRLETGTLSILIGTHALLEAGVNFRALGLVVVDEQHRFGVRQRLSLREKGSSPHVLVMSATPIPRTLAMTLYGDLDVSLLDEMPPGRLPPKTHLVAPEKNDDLLSWLGRELRGGRQAYIVYPLVEESEQLDLKDATQAAERLQQDARFAGLPLALLHGRMKGEEKSAILDGFRQGSTRALVTTTVVEVGVDVPAASIMVVEHPERFGLSQLHQLRGRVGRGGGQAEFFLALSGGVSPETMARLRVLVREASGFRVAEEDLKLRGPGELLGTAQHGLPPLRVADLVRDRGLLFSAHEAAARLLASDPELRAAGHRPLRDWVIRTYRDRMPFSSVG